MPFDPPDEGVPNMGLGSKDLQAAVDANTAAVNSMVSATQSKQMGNGVVQAPATSAAAPDAKFSSGKFPNMTKPSGGGSGSASSTTAAMVGAASGGAAAMASVGQSSTSNMLLYNATGAQLQNQYGGSAQSYQNAIFGSGVSLGMINGQSPQDMAGAGMALNQMASGQWGSSQFKQGVAGTNMGTAAVQGMSATQGAQFMQSLYSPQTSMNMMTSGFGGVTPLQMGSGKANSMATFTASVLPRLGIQQSGPNGTYNKQQVAALSNPGSAQNMDLQNAGWSQSMIQDYSSVTGSANNAASSKYAQQHGATLASVEGLMSTAQGGKTKSQRDQSWSQLQDMGMSRSSLNQVQALTQQQTSNQQSESGGFNKTLQTGVGYLADLDEKFGQLLTQFSALASALGGTKGAGAVTTIGGGMMGGTFGGSLLGGIGGGLLGSLGGSVLGKIGGAVFGSGGGSIAAEGVADIAGGFSKGGVVPGGAGAGTKFEDSTVPGNIPAGTNAALYADGAYATSKASSAFISIDVNASDPNATALDIEPGDASPAQAGPWVTARLKAHPGALAILYSDKAEWPQVKAEVAKLPAAAQKQVRYWVADPTGTAHNIAGAWAVQYAFGSKVDDDIISGSTAGLTTPASTTPGTTTTTTTTTGSTQGSGGGGASAAANGGDDNLGLVTDADALLFSGSASVGGGGGGGAGSTTTTTTTTTPAASPSTTPVAGGKTMYDSQYPSIFPKNADLVVSYVDGPNASNFGQAKSIFGNKALSITWTGETADIADVETGFSVSKLPAWIDAAHARGIPKPVIYAIYSGLGTNYQQIKQAVGNKEVSWWLSDWTGKPHTLPGADAVQYGAQASPSGPMITDPGKAGGHTYDLSLVSSTFPYYSGAPSPGKATPKKPAKPAGSEGGTFIAGKNGPEVISVANGEMANVLSAAETHSLLSHTSALPAQSPWQTSPAQQLLLDMTPANQEHPGYARGGDCLDIDVGEVNLIDGLSGDISTIKKAVTEGIRQAVHNSGLAAAAGLGTIHS